MQQSISERNGIPVGSEIL